MNRDDFKPLIIAALKSNNGSAKIHQVCEHVWLNNNQLIIEDPKVLYTWQYDIRWASNKLRRQNVIESKPRGYWTLKRIK